MECQRTLAFEDFGKYNYSKQKHMLEVIKKRKEKESLESITKLNNKLNINKC